MESYLKQKLIETVLYVLRKTGGVDKYHLFKILYFADRSSLAAEGLRIVEDDFKALQYGPVPDKLYGAMRHNGYGDPELIQIFNSAVEVAGDDANNILLAKRDPNMDYIAPVAIRFLDESIEENKNLTFQELIVKSHDKAWENAKNAIPNILSPVDMAEAGGCSREFLEYVREMVEIDCLS